MIDTLITGFMHGNAYAIVALGMSLIFGVSNVANFAHASVFGIGMMSGWWLGSVLDLPLIPTLLLVMVITGVIGLLLNTLVVSPLTGRPAVAALLATIGVGMILDNISQMMFDTPTRTFPALLPSHNIEMLGVRFGTSDIVMLILTVIIMAGIWFFLKHGKMGQAIRATSQDTEAARQMGIPVKRIQNLSFVIASSLAGIAGVFVGMFNSNVSPNTGSSVGMTAFIAATIGGLGSMPGAVAGGFTLGIIESVGVYIFGDGAHDLITYGALLIILIIRPNGLFGGKQVMHEPMAGSFSGGAKAYRIPKWLAPILIIAAAVSPFLASDYFSSVGIQIMIYAIAAMGLTLVSGSAGQVALGQAGPIALGAYTSAILVGRFNVPFLIGVVCGGLVAAVLSGIITFPIWKLSGHYIAIGTIGVGAVTVALIRIAEPITKGSLGITGIPFPKIFGFTLFTPQFQYIMVLAFLLIELAIIMRIRSSHLGKVIESIGNDPVAAESIGIRTSAYKALAYAIASFFAGIAGALMAHQYTYIDPSMFPFAMSSLVLTIAVLGGLNSPIGTIIGAIVLVGSPELLRFMSSGRIIVYGVLLILIILFRPQGLFAKKE
ncbi:MULTISPECIES: ABC transporter permease [Bifidobacterium]|jgi:branched-chain amino acid transport system permease protein|uniref:ABC transporter permease n=1 Tax=Bifidobacterium tibiigranuli TaxID=2172043 RepID=A0A5N6S0E0_9BIFI|nr:ABC transporter permease [Bifidobacterium tibiigranuli]KAE8128007.1 ABC transporter permease [Bifidobacterium tibiigranuli]KAE8128168.1 ABC transporter permease [Bifidobacterium tibiigranuli]MCH3974108.1 ABC transporter permease [Bifidobacterium tibiigranuli]MCH4189138.1 ABC transporter permease [Bifidobacterium tibiigranuli]MCH4204098.1 ABC transporter permease [Bifidobacterium tibiigranuli]